MFDIDAALMRVIEMEGSDLHLKVPARPMIRRHGRLEPDRGLRFADAGGHRGHPPSTCSPTRPKLESFRTDREVDFSYSVPGVARFRVNAFVQRGAVSLVSRAIPFQVKTVEELLLPPVISEIADEERGLILLTGTTGSGKSTTLAAMIDHINSSYAEAHRHDRGPGRVPAHATSSRSSTSARWARTPPRSAARCAGSCARTPT